VLERAKRLSLSQEDIVATLTAYTARSIAASIRDFCPERIDKLVVGGGGSRNQTLLSFLRKELAPCPILIQEDIGLDSDSKEAVAFAVLANEAVEGLANSLPRVTGARHPVVMGKVSF
jgi:anhydro-N-acetylmuramic acid kinase